MEPVTPTAAGSVFEQAKRDFIVGDFASALIRAQEADALAFSQARVTHDSAVSNPIYSIIVVTYRDIPDVYEAFSRLDKYSRLVDYEIILVNNGNPAGFSIAQNLFTHFKWIEVGFNYCCSGARNLGAQAARGDFLIFVDDDGYLADGAIENLIEIIEKYRAVTVRGRVLPKSTSGIAGSRYDLGEEVVISGPNAECLLICRRDEYIKHGGFDTLLAGHEGWALCSKMFPFHGPGAFLYAPRAVIFHDFATDFEHAAQKMEAYNYNNNYLAQYYPSVLDLRRTLGKTKNNIRTLNCLDSYSVEDRFYKIKKESHPVSVLATASLGAKFLREFTEGLRSQTHANFELIFMPAASDDKTAECMEALWQSDGRLRLFAGSTSRSSALNAALALANHDICVVADAEYISHPRRLEFTVRHMLANPEQACVSFTSFNEQDVLITPWGNTSRTVGIRTRTLLGMPISFQTLGFRKAQFKIPFTASIGEDLCWIQENFKESPLDGTVIPLNLVFDRVGSCNEDPLRDSVALSCIYSLHEQLVGRLSVKDKLCVQMLSGMGLADGAVISEIRSYVSRLIQSNLNRHLYYQDQLELFLFARLSELKSSERKRLKRL